MKILSTIKLKDKLTFFSIAYKSILPTQEKGKITI